MSDHAPGELEIVRAFVNTLDVESGSDDLASVAALQAWLEGRGSNIYIPIGHHHPSQVFFTLLFTGGGKLGNRCGWS